jgi:hypothetical protein
VRVTNTATGDGRLMVTITAGRGDLQAVRLGTPSRPLANAVVDVPGGPTGISTGYVMNPTPGTNTVAFYVRRVGAEAATVPLILTDQCGPWETFVGGGPQAF